MESRVLRNSLFLIIQPIILNALSIFVIGYMARKLGTSDFGIFNFVTTFLMLFLPLGRMGLDNISIRELAAIRGSSEKAESYVGGMLAFRLSMAAFAVCAFFVVSYALQYDERMELALYAGAVILFFHITSEALSDFFRAYERMEFTALISLISGLTLTVLSVVVLYMGYGLFTVIWVYGFGHLLGSILAVYIISRRFLKIRLRLDTMFWKEALASGMPFFLMSMMWYSMMRLDAVFLSKVVGAGDLGIYTAAITLVARLSVIPQGITSSMYPALSNMHANNRVEEMNEIIRKYFMYILIGVIPIVILVSFYSEPIAVLIFGWDYIRAGFFLKYSVWVLFMWCIAFMGFSVLAAIKRQNQTLIAYIITSAACVALNSTVTLKYGAEGAMFAFIATQFILLAALSYLILKSVPLLLNAKLLLKGLLLNCAVVVLLYSLTPVFTAYNYFMGLFILSPIILACYLFGLMALKVIQFSDLTKIAHIVRAG